jgi:hypothetical protein
VQRECKKERTHTVLGVCRSKGRMVVGIRVRVTHQ